MRSQAHRSRVHRLVNPSHRLAWATVHDEAQRLEVGTCRYCKGRERLTAEDADEAMKELGEMHPQLTALVTALTAEELRELAADLEKE
jgi:hypothetical protein